MSFRPTRYVIVGCLSRKIEAPEPITDLELEDAIFRQHCADLMGEPEKPAEVKRDVFWQPIERKRA